MSATICNSYPKEIEKNEMNTINEYHNDSDRIKNDSNKANNSEPISESQNDNTLPNIIKDLLLELTIVARELSPKLSSNNSTNDTLIKQVSEIVDAYLTHLNIIKQQYNYHTKYLNNNFNNNNDTNNNYHNHPVVTSLMNLKIKIEALLEKLKSWNNGCFKWWYNVNKLNKYFEKIDEEWRNLLLNISVNNISESLSDSKKNINFSGKNKELEKNPLEIYITGEKYFYGIGTEKSYTSAFKNYSKATEYSMPEAMYMVGLMYEKGYGVSSDICMAIYWYNEATKYNYEKAFSSLGNIYENGIGVQKNYKKAYEFYKNGSDIGDVNCFTNLGHMYENGLYVEENINKAVYWYQLASQKNCPKAQLALGKIYYYGTSPNNISTLNQDEESFTEIKRNFTEAINLFQKSAEQGEAEAQVYLGLCYQNGYGVVKDHLMAKMNFEKAAKQNDILGSLYLGKIYMKENNVNAALNSFLIALSKGSVDALYYIGKLYDTKEDENINIMTSCIGDSGLLKSCSTSYLMPSDKTIALKFYLQAAEKGHTLAQYRLGNYYCLCKQYIIALYWYLKSSQLSKCQNALGQFYELGLDTEFNNAVSLTGLTTDCLLHYSVDQLYSFYNHYRQMVQQANQKDSSNLNLNTKPRSNLKEAKKWYYRSIRQGNADAAFNLGQLYETRCVDLVELSKETEKDIEEREMSSINDDFTHNIPLHKLTKEEIAEGQSRYIQKAILLYEKAKKLGSKEAAERLKQLQSIAYNNII